MSRLRTVSSVRTAYRTRITGDIKTINREILTIGPILAKCDALEVYPNGTTWGQPGIPKDFFVQPGGKNQKYTVSFLRHKGNRTKLPDAGQ